MSEPENLIFQPHPDYKQFVDLSGCVFHRITVLGFAGWRSAQNGKRAALWHCQCDCGTVKVFRGSDIKNGHTRSCGCLRNEETSARCTTHGKSVSEIGVPIYKVWASMIQRTINPKAKNYQNYGGRGITIEPAWMNIETFISDMGPRPSMRHSLDRIDNDLGYSKDNCRWATRAEQSRNMRSNVNVEINGVSMCVSDWCAKLGLNRSTVGNRMHSGMSPKQALLTPIKDSERIVEVDWLVPPD